MKKIVFEEYKNMIVAVFENNGIYKVSAVRNGRIVCTLATTDKHEAQKVYSETVYAMYA